MSRSLRVTSCGLNDSPHPPPPSAHPPPIPRRLPEDGEAERPHHQGAPQIELGPLPHEVLTGEHQRSVQAAEHEGLAPAEREHRVMEGNVYVRHENGSGVKKVRRIGGGGGGGLVTSTNVNVVCDNL